MNNDLSLHGILSSGGSDAAGNNAAGHNSIYRGKDLTNLYSVTEICNRIANGTFEDLYIGDYFDITLSTSFTSSETVRCVIAGFNYYYGKGSTAMLKNHAVIVPKNCFTAKKRMNETNTTEGGYYNSEMQQTTLPVYQAALESVFGSTHVLQFSDLLTTAVDTSKVPDGLFTSTGRASSYSWYNIKIRLMNEVQVFGCKVLSSSYQDVGVANSQLPLFTHNPGMIVAGSSGTADLTSSNRYYYWLSSVVSSTTFGFVYFYGFPTYSNASNAYGLRPLWLIG